MTDLETVLGALLAAPKIPRSLLTTAPTEQGVYVLWLDGAPPLCLKVGIAGPRRGEGVRGHLELHFKSHRSNSVLARHLAADGASPWCAGHDFTVREQRQRFLAERCYFQAVAVPSLSRRELLEFEAGLIRRLQPKYSGRVKS